MRVTETRVYQMRNLNENDRVRFDSCRPLLIERIRDCLPVLNKVDFYRRFYAGEFGNHGPMWSSIEDWRSSRYPGPIAIRSLAIGGRCDYNIAPDQVDTRTREFHSEGWHKLNWSAMAPTEQTLIQGEARLGLNGIDLWVAREKLPMRDALSAGGFHVDGALAVSLLRNTLCGSSYDWLTHLLDTYADHVIEFSTFGIPWGVIPGMNTVFWEVRRY